VGDVVPLVGGVYRRAPQLCGAWAGDVQGHAVLFGQRLRVLAGEAEQGGHGTSPGKGDKRDNAFGAYHGAPPRASAPRYGVRTKRMSRDRPLPT
ncbi:MAG: hypothetical protein ACK56I_26540, partial [bacterium]